MITVIGRKLSECLPCGKTERTPTGVRQWWLTAHAGTFEGAGVKFHVPSTPLCESRLVIVFEFRTHSCRDAGNTSQEFGK